MLKKIYLATTVAVAMTAAVVPTAIARSSEHPDISDLGDYVINVVGATHHNGIDGHGHHHDTHHHIEILSGSACDRGGATSASRSITTLATRDSCAPIPYEREYDTH
jgi:hypothetical protein